MGLPSERHAVMKIENSHNLEILFVIFKIQSTTIRYRATSICIYGQLEMTVLKFHLAFLLLCSVFAADYYIEPSPTSPRLCTITRPCTIGLLPSLTTADTVYFLPATTGTSNTYSFGTRTIVDASVVIDSPLISFSGSVLRNTFSTSFTYNSARFSSGSLSTQGVSTVQITGANFTNGAYIVLDGQSVTVTNSVFSGLVTTSNSIRHIIYGAQVVAESLQFFNSRTSGHLISFQPSVTFATTLNLNTLGISFTNCNTTGSSSAIFAVQTYGGRSVNSGGISDLTFTSCNSKASMYVARSIFQSGVESFSIIGSISGMIVTGGSVLKGLIALESTAPQATIEHSTEGLHAVGVDYGSNAIYTLSTAGSNIIQNNILGGFNTVCDSFNLNYIASCSAVSGANVYLDYAYIRGTYANVSVAPFNACTNTTLDVMDVCGLE